MRLLLLPVFALLLSSCATILSGTTDPVRFTSKPSGAEVYANGNYVGTTPCSVDLKKKDYSVELRLKGYQTGRASISSSTGGGWIIADVLFGGLVGIVVDAATGAWNSFDSDHVHANFVAE